MSGRTGGTGSAGHEFEGDGPATTVTPTGHVPSYDSMRKPERTIYDDTVGFTGAVGALVVADRRSRTCAPETKGVWARERSVRGRGREWYT